MGSECLRKKITYLGSVSNSTLTVGLTLSAVNGRLYGQGVKVWGAKDYEDPVKCHGLTWYDIEKGTGKPIEKGVLSEINTGWANETPLADPEGKDLYLYACKNQAWALTWLKIGPDGTPVKAGQATGLGGGSNPG